jgi:hypothetical protein
MSLAYITFENETVAVKSGEKNGKAWEIREQAGTIETPYMKNPCAVSLGKGQGAYKAGRYAFDALRALKVSDFGSIQLARDLKLAPAK